MHAILSEKRFPFCCSECADCCPLSVRPSRRRPSRPVVVVVRRLSVRRVVVCPSASFRRPSSVRPSRRRLSVVVVLSSVPSSSAVLCPSVASCRVPSSPSSFSVRPSIPSSVPPSSSVLCPLSLPLLLCVLGPSVPSPVCVLFFTCCGPHNLPSCYLYHYIYILFAQNRTDRIPHSCHHHWFTGSRSLFLSVF